MSDHDRTPREREDIDPLDPKRVSMHRGDRYDFLEGHLRQAKRVVHQGRSALRKIAPSLFHRVSDERTLRIALDHLEKHGGHAPGPDGLRYEQFTYEESWMVCRGLRDDIRAGEYEPGPGRVCMISKGPGRGERPLIIQSILDRIVQRAIVEIVQPILDPLFDSNSLGYRPKPNQGRLHALALAEHYLVAEKRRIWITEDIKDAFLNVPLSRLLQVLKKRLLADDLTEFIGKVIGDSKLPGLRQGGPLSPLLLNVYLDHFLDKNGVSATPPSL